MLIRCIHKESGHTGTITKEMKGNHLFPDQWGINWDKPGHYYWNDKEKIQIDLTAVINIL